MENTLTLGEKIKNLRMSHGLSQTELADKLHVSRYVISKWENNKSEPDITSLKALSQYFQTSIDDLLENSVSDISITKPTVPEEGTSELDLNNYFVPCFLFICLIVSANVCWVGFLISLYCMYYFYRHRHLRFYKLFLLISFGFLTFNGFNIYSLIKYHLATGYMTIEKID